MISPFRTLAFLAIGLLSSSLWAGEEPDPSRLTVRGSLAITNSNPSTFRRNGSVTARATSAWIHRLIRPAVAILFAMMPEPAKPQSWFRHRP